MFHVNPHMKYHVLFFQKKKKKNNEKVFMNVVCCSCDWHSPLVILRLDFKVAWMDVFRVFDLKFVRKCSITFTLVYDWEFKVICLKTKIKFY